MNINTAVVDHVSFCRHTGNKQLHADELVCNSEVAYIYIQAQAYHSEHTAWFLDAECLHHLENIHNALCLAAFSGINECKYTLCVHAYVYMYVCKCVYVYCVLG